MQIEELTDDFVKELLADFLRKTELCMCAIKTFPQPHKGKEVTLVKFRNESGLIVSEKYTFAVYCGYSAHSWEITSADNSGDNDEFFASHIVKIDENGNQDLEATSYALPLSRFVDKEDMKVKIKSFLEQVLEAEQSNET